MKAMAVMIFLILSFPVFLNNDTGNHAMEIMIPYDEKNQPIDLKISFNAPCYAIDNQHNSIRVFYNGKEIESDIYNLKHTDASHIKSCNIVFLSQGKGNYVIKYGDDEVEHNYKNHVDVVDSHYSYQLFPGYDIKVDYYAIMEEGKCIFSIGQQGSVFGINMGQKVVKMKENALRFDISSWKYVSSFAFFYNNGNEIGTDEKLISKEILFDGNLMARVKIESMSSNEKLKTIAYYTYYYTPSKEKRIFVRFKHIALQNCKVKSEQNGIFAYLMCLKARSKGIKELNMGEILPYIHVSGENGIEEYRMETNPQSRHYKWLLSSKDNVRLGNKPWFCMDNSNAYGIIMDKNASGLEIKALVKKKVDMPGLSVAGGGVSVGRASMDDIPAGFTAEYACELFFADSLKDFENEATAFYDFYGYRELAIPKYTTHNLQIIAHSVIPSRLKAEIWKNGVIVSSSMLSFRRAKFDLPSSNYLVKIFTKNGRFIGERAVKLDEDKKLHIFCSFEGKLKIKTNKGIIAKLIDGNETVCENISYGYIILNAPIFYKYKLQLLYKGILLHEEKIFLPHRNMEFNFKFYSADVNIIDSLGFPVEENLSVSINGKNMEHPIYAERNGKSYRFVSIPSGNYTLRINYKNFKISRPLHIPTQPVTINFPIVYRVRVHVFDNRGMRIKASISFERNGRTIPHASLPPAAYKLKIHYGGKTVEKPIYVSSDETIDVVVKKTSWIVYLAFVLIISAILFFIYRKNYAAALFTSFSISILFPWWYAGNAKLYVIPPVMIELNGNYGSIATIPSMLKFSLLAAIALFFISIALSIFKKYKYSLIPLFLYLSLFVYSIHVLAKFTTGSIYGRGKIEMSATTWGMGIGFYIGVIYAILIVGLVINEIRRGR